MIEQQQALTSMREAYGKTSYTSDTMTYKMVGFVQNGKRIFGIGDTWIQAIESLAAKAGR